MYSLDLSKKESMYLPSEYDSYWGEQEIPLTSPLQVRSTASPALSATHDVNPNPAHDALINQPAASSTALQSPPKLKKRFSWENSDESDNDVDEKPPVSVQPDHHVETSCNGC